MGMKDRIILSDLMTPDYRLWDSLERLKRENPLRTNKSFWAEFISRSGVEYGRMIDMYSAPDLSRLQLSQEIIKVNLYSTMADCYTEGYENFVVATFSLEW